MLSARVLPKRKRNSPGNKIGVLTGPTLNFPRGADISPGGRGGGLPPLATSLRVMSKIVALRSVGIALHWQAAMGRGFDSHRGRANFSAYPVWTHSGVTTSDT